MALVHFQLALEQLKQREGVSSTTSETGDHFVMIQATYFLHVALHHRISNVAWPSPPITTWPLRRTLTIVVTSSSSLQTEKILALLCYTLRVTQEFEAY